MKKGSIKVLFFISLFSLFSLSLTACENEHSHEYKERIINPTCADMGWTEYSCDCGDSYVTSIKPAKGHSYTKTITDSTCEQGGFTTFSCQCGDSYIGELTSPKGHNYSSLKTEPTCKSMGYTTYTCECGDSYKSDFVNSIPHEYEKTVINPTCLEEGYTKNLCECGEEYKSDYIDSLGHDYEESVVEFATCSTLGLKAFKCQRCEDEYTENYHLEELSSVDIFERVNESTGEIITYDKKDRALSLGSCFVYAENGVFATNYHVINGGYSAKLTYNGKTHEIKKVLAYDKEKDIALVSVDLKNLPVLPRCDSLHLEGKIVYAYGSSRGLTATFSQGIITSKERKIGDKTYIQHDAAISSGNSGGPLVNAYGEVIGINTASVTEAQNINLAVRIKDLESLSITNGVTLSQLFEQNDPVTKLKNYAINNNQLENSDFYAVLIANSVNNQTVYSRRLYYFPENDRVMVSIMVNQTCEFGIAIDGIASEYAWLYLDNNSNQMQGLVKASEFTDQTLLGYKNAHNISDLALITNIRSQSTILMQTLLMCFDEDYKTIGVTKRDLGFTKF